MIVMARDRGYDELLESLKGRRVLVWTCNTCARFCGVGGREAAEDLRRRLSADGVEASGPVSSSACGFMRNADRMAEEAGGGYDTILALCCDIGAVNAREATGREVVNPIVTFGSGNLGRDGVPHLVSVVCGRVMSDVPLPDAAADSGCFEGPFRR